MARIRSIKPEACLSEDLAGLSDAAERTFVRLWTHADDDGRGLDNAKLLKAALYPLNDEKSPVVVDALMQELAAAGLIVRYSVAGRRYFAIPTFTDHQNPRHPTPSKYPPPDEDDGSVTAMRGNAAADGRKPPAVVVGGDVVVGGEVAAEPPPSPDGDPFADFWNAYPRNRGNGKPGGGAARHKAQQRWQRLKPAEREACLVAVANYAADCLRPDAPFPAHATTWLNERRWEDWLDAPSSIHPLRPIDEPDEHGVSKGAM